MGAYRDDSKEGSWGDSGSAYIFNVQTGPELHKLVASDATDNHGFGTSVAISGNYAIVGAHFYSARRAGLGKGYIFGPKNKYLVNIENDSAKSDVNGTITTDQLITDQLTTDQLTTDQLTTSRLQVLKHTFSVEKRRLFSSDSPSNDYFGYSVAIFGNYAIVGAYRDDDTYATVS